MRPGFLLWIAGAVITTGVGDFLSKRYSLNPQVSTLACVIAAYVAGVMCWLQMMLRYKNLARAGVMWIVLSAVVLILLSHFVFHETITPRQWCGIVVGVGSLLLLL